MKKFSEFLNEGKETISIKDEKKIGQIIDGVEKEFRELR
jgi:hypothetical protein